MKLVTFTVDGTRYGIERSQIEVITRKENIKSCNDVVLLDIGYYISLPQRLRKLMTMPCEMSIIHDGKNVMFANCQAWQTFKATKVNKILEFVHPDYRRSEKERIKMAVNGEDAGTAVVPITIPRKGTAPYLVTHKPFPEVKSTVVSAFKEERSKTTVLKREDDMLSNTEAVFDIKRGERYYGRISVHSDITEYEKEIFSMIVKNLGHLLGLIEDREMLTEKLIQNVEVISHLVDKIRNPLAAIVGYAEHYIEDDAVKSKIVSQVDRIVEIVSELDNAWTNSEKLIEKRRGDKVKK